MKSFISITAVLALATSVTLYAEGDYHGSSFNEVQSILFDNNAISQNYAEAREIKTYQQGKLPRYWVYRDTFFAKENGEQVNLLAMDAKRTINEKHDYYERLHKRLHPNGICFTGSWEITEASDYSGYFAQGKKALLIARASVTMSNTEQGSLRGFGFAGKLFPTDNADETVATANFFLVDILLGSMAAHYTDVAMTNEPSAGFDFLNLYTGLAATEALVKADSNPLFRPLYPISELGVTAGEAVKTPKWMMIKAAANTAKVDAKDFRDELAAYDGLMFDIYVSDTTNDPKQADWTALGVIQLTESVVSYGCDRQLHFAHPKMR